MMSLWSLCSSRVFKPGLISLMYSTSSIACYNFIVFHFYVVIQLCSSIVVYLYSYYSCNFYSCIVIIQCNYIVIVLYLYSSQLCSLHRQFQTNNGNRETQHHALLVLSLVFVVKKMTSFTFWVQIKNEPFLVKIGPNFA